MRNTLKYLDTTGGVMTEKDYPYTAKVRRFYHSDKIRDSPKKKRKLKTSFARAKKSG